MKKFIQITLIVVLVLVLLQTMVGGPMASAGELGSKATNDTFFTANESVDNVYAASCWQLRTRELCVKPLVGWNG
jgi:hypothetical protein